MLLEVRDIQKSYGQRPALVGVSFSVTDGEIVCLLGPSGCGKSTLLRVIAGLETDYRGSIRFAGTPIDRVPVHERGFGFMFQDYALLPHRSVGQNIAFGLRMQRLARPDIERRVQQILELVGLPGYADRSVFELSGGERQRVALARSLAPEPRLLMLDEPLGALDRTLRERLTAELREIIKRVRLTSLYVTHDQNEAFAVADRILLMDRGAIVQDGTPAEVYRHPAGLFAARFLGFNNLLPGDVSDAGSSGSVVVNTAVGPLLVGDVPPGGGGTVLVRPEAAEPAGDDLANVVEGEIVRRTFRGDSERIVLRHASGTELELDVEADEAPSGSFARLSLRPDQLTLVADDSRRKGAKIFVAELYCAKIISRYKCLRCPPIKDTLSYLCVFAPLRQESMQAVDRPTRARIVSRTRRSCRTAAGVRPTGRARLRRRGRAAAAYGERQSNPHRARPRYQAV